MTRYVERPKLIRAIQFTGGNAKTVFDFCKKRIKWWKSADFEFVGTRGAMSITCVSLHKTYDVRGSWRINGEYHNPVIAREPCDVDLYLNEGDYLVQPKGEDPFTMSPSQFHQRYVETA